jgi:hypothetical protein
MRLYNVMPSMRRPVRVDEQETTLGYVINVHELTSAASQINNQLLTKPFHVFFILASIYFIRVLEPHAARASWSAASRQAQPARRRPRRRKCRRSRRPLALRRPATRMISFLAT